MNLKTKSKGAIGMNILLFMFVSAALLYIVGYNTTAQSVFSFVGIDPATGNINGGNLALAFAAILLGSAIIAGTFSFPNPYAIFAGIAGVILLIVVTVWTNFIGSVGFPLTQIGNQQVPIAMLVVGGLLGFLGLLATIAFLKGGEW